VSCQLEQPHDADDAEELEYIVVLLQIVEQKVEVETDGGDKVDDVDGCENERELAWTDDEPDSATQLTVSTQSVTSMRLCDFVLS